jgi:hypothetical protein
MASYKHCNDPKCQREIEESIFNTATAHALGCKLRRSLAAKDAFAAKSKRQERGRKAAATRAARKLASQPLAVDYGTMGLDEVEKMSDAEYAAALIEEGS